MNVAEFFDSYAQHWDDDYVPVLPVRTAVALICGAYKCQTVLDIACGTGAMFKELLEIGNAEITGVDISPKMAQIAALKFSGEPRVKVVCLDVAELRGQTYDCAVMYNAYPHFPDKAALLKTAARLLNTGGRFTVAHGNGRDKINAHHAGVSEQISTKLKSAKEEAALWEPLFDVDCTVDTPDFYLISGTVKLIV